jgi:hypothetical protein
MKYALRNSDIHSQGGGALFYLTGCDHDWVKETRTCKKCDITLTKDQRYIGKRYNHASSYGMSEYKAMEVINADSDKPPFISISLSESRDYSKSWHAFYNVKDWWFEVKEKDRHMVTSYDRERTFYGQWGDELEREKIAFEPQSTVGDHFNGKVHPLVGKKGGLIEIYRQLIRPFNCGNVRCLHPNCHKIINQSHDSAILELPIPVAKDVGLEAEQLLLRPMVVKDEEFTIPTDGLIGERWSEGEMEKLAA